MHYKLKVPPDSSFRRDVMPLRPLKRERIHSCGERRDLHITHDPKQDSTYGAEFALRDLVRLFDHHEQPRRQSQEGDLIQCAKAIAQMFNEHWARNCNSVVMFSLMPIAILLKSIESVSEPLCNESLAVALSPSRLVSFGKWCPSRINRFFFSNFLGNAIADMLPSYDAGPYDGCSPQDCQYSSSNTLEIWPTHAEGCQGDCGDWCSIQEKDLIPILDGGGSPCFLLHENKLQLIVSDASNQPYIAISHVWSHGLGNPVQNALPWCQIRMLFDIIESIQEGAVSL